MSIANHKSRLIGILGAVLCGFAVQCAFAGPLSIVDSPLFLGAGGHVRKDLPEDLQGAIFVEAPIDEGIFVIRSFVPDDSWKPIVSRFLDQSSCELQDF